MPGNFFRPTGTFIAYEDGEINDKRYKKRIATSSDWRKHNSDGGNTIGMGTDGNFYVLTAIPEEVNGGNQTGGSAPTKEEVKVATPDIVNAVHEKAYSDEKAMQAFFEDLGLQEILSITRNSAVNIVNGQNVLYQPIENIATLSLKYNSLNILPLQSADTVFKNFSISLEDKLVTNGDGTGPNGESEYLDSSNNLVINITNLQPDEFVEIESLNIESLIDGTIYEGAP